MSAKSELRRQLKHARLSLSPEARQAKSTAIMGHLWQAIDWSAVQKLHCYEPIERLGEVDISDFVTALQDEYPNLQLFTSRQINGEWQIVALPGGKVTSQHLFDVIIVPMLGFDAALHRVGYGGGYYDRFLAAQTQAQKIGVCFEQGRLDHIPTEPHDIALDRVISEIKIYTRHG